MKNTLLTFGLTGLTTVLLSFTLVQKTDEVQEPKKSRHIKMTKIENGKKMELDTVITGDQVFVWKGDTIGGKGMVKHFGSSGSDQKKHVEVFVDQDGKNEKVMIFHKGDKKGGEPLNWNWNSGDDTEIITEDIDSLGKRIVVRKRTGSGDENRVIYLNGKDRMHFPPVPPVPPVPHVRMMKMQHSGQIINLNDPNIVSFKKKEMSGDREKIEIIRKKSEGPKDMTFDFEFDNESGAPEAPEAPVFDGEHQKMKIMEKEIKVDGKKGKEIQVEVESKENK